MDRIDAKRYDRGMWSLERMNIGSLRRGLLQYVTGRVLEVGAGTGANIALYPPGIDLVTVEMRPQYASAAAEKAVAAYGRRSAAPLLINVADAQDLPFATATFDTVVGTLVFCSIADPALAMGEVRRVLKPGGRFLLLEHVRGQGAISRRLTDWLNPFWLSIQGECHLNRETARTVAQAGFDIQDVSTHARGVLQAIRAFRPLD